MQFVSVALVAKGLFDTTARFRDQSVTQFIREGFASLLPSRPPIQTIQVGMAVEHSEALAPELVVATAEGTELERRVHGLEQNLKQLLKGIREDMGNVEKRFGRIETKLGSEAEQRIRADLEMTEKLRDQFARGVVEALLGLAIMLAATAYSGIPDLLAKWFPGC